MTDNLTQDVMRKHDILENEYDRAPYQSFPFSHTHPSHLYTLAKLFALKPKAIEKARILELGCAGGGNLIPMAFHYPQAEFIGIDLSLNQINDGLQQVNDLKLKNITLKHQSILDFTKADGTFDYIICHGVYSWVSNEVKDKILQICQENLSKNGIAYVSYNTFPGWNMVNSVKDLMMWHTQNIKDPANKALQARSILKFLVDGLQDDKSAYAETLRNEINILSRQADSYLLHEHLSTYNQPVYFHQFMEQANKHKLSYLSDAVLATMFTDNLPPAFANELKKINNIIIIGQYMDFIRNQRFRCTLLCHQDQQVNRALKTNDIEDFYIQFIGKADLPNFSEKDIGPGKEISFSNGAITLKVRNPLSQLAMLILIEEQIKPIHYKDLCEKLSARSNNKDLNAIKHNLNEELNLMRTAFAGLINISSFTTEYVTSLSNKPTACSLARYQAQKFNHITNRRHQVVALDPLTKIILPLLDGTHDIDAIVKVVCENIENKTLSMLDEKQQPVTDKADIAKRANIICKATLENMVKQAILVS